jgi:hypothetical protein
MGTVLAPPDPVCAPKPPDRARHRIAAIAEALRGPDVGGEARLRAVAVAALEMVVGCLFALRGERAAFVRVLVDDALAGIEAALRGEAP